MSDFQGFPTAALDFYDDLEMDNTRPFWEAHKAVYAESVKAPIVALTDALAPEFGTAKIFRPYRDVRFAKDKRPYNRHVSAILSPDGSKAVQGVFYVHIGLEGCYAGVA